MPGLTIRAYNHDTKVPKTGTDTASCHLKSTDLTYPSRIRSGLLPRNEARGYHRSPAISPSHTRKDRIARYAHDAGPAGRRFFGPANPVRGGGMVGAGGMETWGGRRSAAYASMCGPLLPFLREGNHPGRTRPEEKTYHRGEGEGEPGATDRS